MRVGKLLFRAWVYWWRCWPGVIWRLRRVVAPLNRRAFDHERRLVTQIASGRDCAVLAIHRGRRQLRLYRCRGGAPALVKSYTVGVGRLDARTPRGKFAIQTLLEEPVWHVPDNPLRSGRLAGTVVPAGSPENRILARWLGFCDGIGIHGTEASRLGIGCSDGCILMTVSNVIDLYSRVELNSPVIVR
jgi:L,D-transpeptidase catalytic domain